MRYSNFELLRIVAMYLIVLHHECLHGALKFGAFASTESELVVNVLIIGGKLGVMLFVMITGYFMVKSRFKAKSFTKVLLQTLFYAVAVIVVFGLFFPEDITRKSALGSLMLNTSGGLPWFAVAYLGLYLFIPFINKLALSLSRDSYRKLLVVGAVCLSAVPTFLNVTFISSYFAWFVYLYLLAGYLRLFDVSFGVRQLAIMIAVPLSFVAFSAVLMTFCPAITEALGISARYFAGTYSFFLLIAAIGMFLAFARLHVSTSRFVNAVASTTFGIYLIHDNGIIRPWLWSHFQAVFALSAPALFAGLLVVAFGVFSVCSLVDYARSAVARLLAIESVKERTAALYRKVDNWFCV